MPARLTVFVYDAIIGPLLRGVRTAVLATAPPAPGLRVLDVGCGTGLLLAAYRDGGSSVIGVDRTPAMVHRAAARLAGRGRVVRGEATGLPFGDGEFEVAAMSMMLHETPPERRADALAEMRRVTAGPLVVADYEVAGAPGRMTTGARWLEAVIERVAGGDHHRNYLAFMASGGIPEVAAGAGLSVAARRTAAAGTIGVYTLV